MHHVRTRMISTSCLKLFVFYKIPFLFSWYPKLQQQMNVMEDTREITSVLLHVLITHVAISLPIILPDAINDKVPIVSQDADAEMGITEIWKENVYLAHFVVSKFCFVFNYDIRLNYIQ